MKEILVGLYKSVGAYSHARNILSQNGQYAKARTLDPAIQAFKNRIDALELAIAFELDIK